MILAYKFDYVSDNENLAFFLKFYAQKSGLNFGLKRQENLTTLFVEGKEEELLRFSDELALVLPHSLFLQNSRVYVADMLGDDKFEPKNTLSNITPSVANGFKKGLILPCENGKFSDVSIFMNGKFTPVTQQNFSELLEFALSEFLDGKSVKFKDEQGEFELLNFNELGENFNVLMPTNLKNLPKIFIANKNEQIALASYEKPIVNLKTTAIYRSNHKGAPKFFDVCAAQEIFIYAFCEKLFEKGVNFVAIKSGQTAFRAVVLENGFLTSGSCRYYLDENLARINEAKDKNLENFYLAQRELKMQDEGTLRLFLSKFKDDEIKIYPKFDDFNVLNFALPASFEELFELIKSEEGGVRLLENFSQHFTLPSGNINVQNGFFGLFCIVGVLFGFDKNLQKAGEKLLQNASDFNGLKGVRLDFKMLNKTYFDVVKFVRSGMSFKLAGADEKLLSYGCVESLVHFLDGFLDVMKEDFDVQNVLLQGALFKNKTLANLALKHLNTSLNAKFSTSFVLEL